MQPLERATRTADSYWKTVVAIQRAIEQGNDEGQWWIKMLGMPAADIRAGHIEAEVRRQMDGEEIWRNDIYQVHKKVVAEKDGPMGRIVHLSLRRLDREPITDWRHKQAIKNQLCGDETEGVELYPAESRVVDTANQYHIWVFLDMRVPVGYSEGARLDASQSLAYSRQRPFGEK